MRCGLHSSGQRRASRPSSSGPMRSVCGRRCGTWRSGSPPKATRCSCRIRSIASAKAPVCRRRLELQLRRPGTAREAHAADGIDQRGGRRRERMRRHSSPGSTRSRRSTHKKIGTQGYCMGGALVVQNGRRGAESRRRRRLVPRRRAGDRRTRTARICWRRRSRRGCISASPPTTTCSSRTRRRS